MTIRSYTLAELTHGLDVNIRGDAQCLVDGISPIHEAKPSHITFLSNPLYRKYLSHTKAIAVILNEHDLKYCGSNAVVCKNPYYIYAKIAAFFLNSPSISAGIHNTVMIGKNCHIHESASIAANCVIGDGVKIGSKVVIGPGCIIGNQCELAEGVSLDARVTLYHHVRIGKRSRIASGAVIGADGFGFAREKNIWHKVPQLGGVEIGEDVDIGANTTIDRGALEPTIIEDGVKLDNQIQIGHNVKIGAHSIMAGCTGVAGSATIGKYCMIGGASLIAGHISLTDGVMLTAATGVSKSIHEPGIYSSGVVGAVPNQEFRKQNARFHRLPRLMARVKALEEAINIKDVKEQD